MTIKATIEARIIAVTNYAGAMPLPEIIAKAATRAKLSHPEWLCARACMTASEYLQFGNCGQPWKYMEGRRDMAERAVAVARACVQDVAAQMSLECDWTQIHARVRRAA